MRKKYIVELTDGERVTQKDMVTKFWGTSQKVQRGNFLLKANANGPGWTDARIAEAFGCRTKTVDNVRQRFVELGFEIVLNGRTRKAPPTEQLLDGEQEAKIIATRLGTSPQGYGKWTLRLLARKVVELKIVESVSYQTVRRTLEKREGDGRRSAWLWLGHRVVTGDGCSVTMVDTPDNQGHVWEPLQRNLPRRRDSNPCPS